MLTDINKQTYKFEFNQKRSAYRVYLKQNMFWEHLREKNSIEKPSFLDQFKMIVLRYKRVDYNIHWTEVISGHLHIFCACSESKYRSNKILIP